MWAPDPEEQAVTDKSDTPIFDQLLREKEQPCPPDPPADTEQDAGDPAWPSEQPS